MPSAVIVLRRCIGRDFLKIQNDFTIWIILFDIKFMGLLLSVTNSQGQRLITSNLVKLNIIRSEIQTKTSNFEVFLKSINFVL